MAVVGSLYTLLSIFLAKDCIPMPEAVKILRHHNVTSDDRSLLFKTPLICTNPLTKEDRKGIFLGL
ncbi:hypothetical protein D6D38_08255 [Rahnella variigena]|jgi:hypothetical protein|uniref:Uncharacterized protein n=1 Tax=Rahnella woolbedingensis TaxID=1510574 RepID=A0A419NA81_9GAMM|nr:hypothetical protein C2125_03125 [Rahnella aquatilis]RJT44828.1 hypothetical protein D6C13_09385 [Rahnella woolbedingensis]RJT54377.1 hypothetical protein D6D38_08255 [Rahnella variigena]RYJ12001.1 hypothetical protein C5Y41_21100 [Rahnella variigena]